MPLKQESTNYILKSFICHHGSSLHSGHYTSYISVKNTWYHIDDRSFTTLNEQILVSDQVIKENIYLIVYEQKDN